MVLRNKQIYGYSDLVLDHYSKESTNDGSNLNSVQSVRSTGTKGKENVTQGLQLNKDPQSVNGSIEANFKRAIVAQNEEYNEVTDFLSSLKMEKYTELFIEHGVEDNDTILELKEEHLQEMGLPLGHKLKIMKKIKECRKHLDNENQSKTIISNPQQVASGTTTDVNSNNLLDGEYDEEQNK